MTDKNLLRRIERIEENLLADEPPTYKLPLSLQEDIDRLIRREPSLKKDLRETEKKIDQPHSQRQQYKWPPGHIADLQASLDRLIARIKENEKKVSEDSKGGKDE